MNAEAHIFFFLRQANRKRGFVGLSAHADTELDSSLSCLQRVIFNRSYDDATAGEARRARGVRRRCVLN